MSQLHQLLLPPGPAASLLGHLPSTTTCLLKTHVGDFYSGSGTPSSVSVAVPMVQRQLSQHLLSANMLAKALVLVGRGAVVATNCTFFFKFLKITKWPLYMGCKIIHVASNPGSTLDFAVFVPSRIWWQSDGGSKSAMEQALLGAFPLKQPREWWHSWGVSAMTQPWSRSQANVIMAKNSFRKGLAKGQLCYIIMTRSTCHCLFFHLLFKGWNDPISHLPDGFSFFKNCGIKKVLPLNWKKWILSKNMYAKPSLAQYIHTYTHIGIHKT